MPLEEALQQLFGRVSEKLLGGLGEELQNLNLGLGLAEGPFHLDLDGRHAGHLGRDVEIELFGGQMDGSRGGNLGLRTVELALTQSHEAVGKDVVSDNRS